MLISFKGRGCKNCPFYRLEPYDYRECWLDDQTVDDIPIEINDGNELPMNPPKDWPKGCPFGEHVGTLQITALDGTC